MSMLRAMTKSTIASISSSFMPRIITILSLIGVIPAAINCNRVRLTAKGRLILCLGQENSIALRDAIRANMSDDEIKSIIISAINNKPERHEFNTNINNINNVQMVEIGG
jgi:cyclic pyranopterin phosphate synthase